MSEMENEHRISPLSSLLEARCELRGYIALESVLIERTLELPEDDFCHNAREALALGAGYAYHSKENANDEAVGMHVFSAFFDTQPRNRYIDEMTERRNQQALIKAALDQTQNDNPDVIDETIDPYKVEELAAFIEGYAITKDYFSAQTLHHRTANSQSA